jgi:endonuclease/exonuclease/phosphatase family metal-dependent hydrolase
MICVASYNIRRGLGTDRRRNLNRNLAVMREIDADVIAVQEADPVLGDLFTDLPPETIEAETDYLPVRLGATRADIAWHGNVVLARRTAVVLATHCVGLPSFEEQRGAAIVDLSIAGVQLRVVAMHLGLIGMWRTRQAVALLERMKAFDTSLPTVMLGDLNEWNAGASCLAHFAREHHIASPGRSFPTRLPLFALDKIVINAELHLVAAGVHDTPLARVASDHLPVWARIAPAGANHAPRAGARGQDHARAAPSGPRETQRTD